MVEFKNLKVWNPDSKDFVISDLNFGVNTNISLPDDKVIDGSNFVCLPLGIDIHVHFREPGYTHKEDMLSGAEAALHGGVTTVLEMPNTNPITDSVEQILYKKEIAQKVKFVDILIAAAITDDNYNNLITIDEHCDAYKIFMSESFGNLSIKEENIESSLNFLEQIGSSKPIFFHAEDASILHSKSEEKEHFKQRPPEAEAVAVQSILRWAHDYSALKFHITHVSSALSLKLLEFATLDNLTTDTCPRYLYFDQETDLSPTLKKVNPPLRTPNDRNQLIEALSKGVINMISSDHSPHTLEEKENSEPSGMPGVQTLIPSLMTLVQANELEWERAIEAYHTFPSKLLNLEHKNILQNCMILDTINPFEVNKNWIKSKSQWSPFEGRMLQGRIKYVIKSEEIIHIS
jgi:dihydroorotase